MELNINENHTIDAPDLNTFRQITDHSQEMIFKFNKEGSIIYCNQTVQEELGYGQEIMGLPIYSVFVPENNEDNIFYQVKEPREHMELIAYRKNATCFPVIAKMFPDDKKTGYVYLMSVNVIDIRNLEKEVLFLKEEAEGSRQIRNEFIANVTHELRTPVNGIIGHTFSLLQENPSLEQRRTLEIIQRCCLDMSSIINNILDFSKLDAGKIQLNESEFDFHQMMDHVMATHIAIINKKGLRIFLNISENIPRHMVGDELRLIQILNNLLANAVKFTDIGYVSVDVTKNMQYGDEIELFVMVRDSGIGISSEDKDLLFQSFSQVDPSLTRRYNGTGLGLVITKELVELMGGSIQVESQPGRGSNFSFTVRLHMAQSGHKKNSHVYISQFFDKNEKIMKFDEIESFYQFGSAENMGEIKNKAEKLILALELGAWEKAEVLADNLKKLIEGGPEDMRKMVFRLEMSIRKEDEGKSKEYYEVLKKMLEDTLC